MELVIYNGEYFERNKLWYTIFFLVIGIIGIIAIAYKDILGIVIILLLAGGYFFILTKVNEITTIEIEESWITINKKHQPRNTFSGFLFEFHTKKQTIHNIVFITPKGHDIYTINDTDDNIKTFAATLKEYIPLVEDYHQTSREKFLRKIKL